MNNYNFLLFVFYHLEFFTIYVIDESLESIPNELLPECLSPQIFQQVTK